MNWRRPVLPTVFLSSLQDNQIHFSFPDIGDELHLWLLGSNWVRVPSHHYHLLANLCTISKCRTKHKMTFGNVQWIGFLICYKKSVYNYCYSIYSRMVQEWLLNSINHFQVNLSTCHKYKTLYILHFTEMITIFF